jgi:hypothetical protein
MYPVRRSRSAMTYGDEAAEAGLASVSTGISSHGMFPPQVGDSQIN